MNFSAQNKSISLLSYIQNSILFISFVTILFLSIAVAIITPFYSPSTVHYINDILSDKDSLKKNITDLILSGNEFGIDALNIENKFIKNLDHSFLVGGDKDNVLKHLKEFYESCHEQVNYIDCIRGNDKYVVSLLHIKNKYFRGHYVQSIKADSSNIFLILVFICSTVIVFVSFIFIFFKLVVRPRIKILLQKSIDLMTSQNVPGEKDQKANLIDEFETITKKISELKQLEYLNKKQDDIIEQAEHIRHDIKSPLNALNLFFIMINGKISETEKKLGYNSLRRAHDIINSLPTPRSSSNTSTNLKPEIVYLILQRIISEKRMEYRLSNDIEINLNLPKTHTAIFAKISASDFSRSISNIINNSTSSAYKKNIKIIVTVDYKVLGNKIVINISDNGLGFKDKIENQEISKDFINKYGSKEGLGLNQVLYFSEKSNASLFLSSEPKNGTSITIELPICPQAAWFANSILIQNEKIVCIDDDTSIHDIWRNRIEDKIDILNFYRSDEFEEWICKEKDTSIYTFLFDYELIGSKKNGINLIKKYKLANQSVLVTNKYDHSEIQDKCIELQIKVVPKDCAPTIPLLYKNKRCGQEPLKKTDYIYIDDDFDFLEHLQQLANQKNIKIAIFPSIDKFIENCHLFDLNVPISVDSFLGNGVLGEHESSIISKHGFKNVYLSSGRNMKNIKLPSWICGYREKGYPIINLDFKGL